MLQEIQDAPDRKSVWKAPLLDLAVSSGRRTRVRRMEGVVGEEEDSWTWLVWIDLRCYHVEELVAVASAAGLQ